MDKFNAEKHFIETGALKEISILTNLLRGSDVWLLKEDEVVNFIEILHELQHDIYSRFSEQFNAVDDGLEAIGRYIDPK